MSTDTPSPQESTGTETEPNAGTDPNAGSDSNARTVTGPHDGRDSDGELDHRYWRCRRCGLETTDPRLREGCFRCGADATNGDESEAADGNESDATNRADPDATDRAESAVTDGGAPDG